MVSHEPFVKHTLPNKRISRPPQTANGILHPSYLAKELKAPLPYAVAELLALDGRNLSRIDFVEVVVIRIVLRVLGNDQGEVL